MTWLALFLSLFADVGGFSFTRAAPTSFTFRRVVAAPKKSVVKFYTATWCEPCKPVHEAIEKADKAGELPFTPEFVDISNGNGPEWCTAIPAVSWEHKGRTRFILAPFPGVPTLIERWKATNTEQPLAQTAIRLTPQQQSLWSKARQAGYSDAQILNYARKNGMIR